MNRVVVIGAGLTGLAAADELVRLGREPIVLEARDRVGGRVHSVELANGAVVEMGAEFILPGCTSVLGLAERFGLGLWDKTMRYGTREPRGVEVTAEALAAAAAEIDRELAAAPRDESAQDLLERVGIDEGARQAVTARAEVSAAAPAAEVPASELGGLARISDEPAPGIAGGNDRLATALAGELAGRIHLDTAVRELEWGTGGIVARTGEGEVHADACVIAVPASVIGRIAFDPPLPEPLSAALGRIAYGHAAKLFVPLREAAPASATLSVPDRFWAWTATGEGDQPQPVVSAFAGSAPALERLGVADGPERWLARLEELRPDLALERTEPMLSTWDDDPWVEAAYSLDPGEEVRAAVAAAPAGLAFAGEHLAGEFGALMEGALRSGAEAARSLP